MPTIERRPTPLAVRLSQAEKNLLTDAARQIGSSRNALVRTAALSLVRQLKADGLAR
jgi:uncharacterized protein (DUF1778 family)